MKTFEGQNHYQILNVPGSATAIEIRRAYQDALEIYREDSIATYSLFSSDQREVLLRAIEEAFDTLIDADKRAVYDRMLIDDGHVDPATFFRKPAEKPGVRSNTRIDSEEKRLGQWVRSKSNAPEIKALIDQVLSKELLSGEDLKRLREALSIEIHEIHTITRISQSILHMIEADRYDDLPAEIYLKQFLKSYADILQINPLAVVEGYLKLMRQDDPQ
jgi:curved DNA-binding protein CbpA